MSDDDWQTLEECACKMADSGRAVTAGQVAAQLLRDAIAELRRAAERYAIAPASTMRFSENRTAFGSTPAERNEAQMTRHFDAVASAMARLAAAEARTEERLARLKETMDRLAATSAEERTEENFERLAEAVARGFTEAMERHDEIIERLDRLIDRARGPRPRRGSGD